MATAAERESLALGFLIGLGTGEFTYRQVADATGMTRDQACVACLALLRSGRADYVQRDPRALRFELRKAF